MQRIIDIDKFKTIAPEMLWKDAAARQLDAFENAVTDSPHASARRPRSSAATARSPSTCP